VQSDQATEPYLGRGRRVRLPDGRARRDGQAERDAGKTEPAHVCGPERRLRGGRSGRPTFSRPHGGRVVAAKGDTAILAENDSNDSKITV
jgi:hypothetical protein